MARWAAAAGDLLVGGAADHGGRDAEAVEVLDLLARHRQQQRRRISDSRQ
jgi:hypothetical protein